MSNKGPELLNITTAFYTHAYQEVIDFDVSGLSAQNRPTAQILKYRAQIALGQSKEVAATLSKARDAASRAIVALAQQASGNASGLQTATSLAESDPDDAVVQICAGTVLAVAGEHAQAVSLLSKHQGNLEAVALIIQIHLSQNRTDLAIKEVQGAKRWAQDSLLINLAEAWLNLRVGGSEKYQSAFYVYEELATTPGTTSPTALVGQAIAEIHLGRTEEAELALQQALSGENVDVEAIANSIVLASVMGKKSEVVQGLVEQLKAKDKSHAVVLDLQQKESEFDAAAAKFASKQAA